MRLPRAIEQCVAYLYADTPSAETGAGEGATAFWVGVDVAGGARTFLVTCRHVIEDGYTTIRYSSQGKTKAVGTDEAEWYSPQDNNVDLAIYSVDNFAIDGIAQCSTSLSL